MKITTEIKCETNLPCCCPECGHLLPAEQVSKDVVDPDRWKCCPYCGKPIKWEVVTRIIPGKFHCKVCESWLGTIEPDGRSYASSHYNGTDICDPCMTEHCMETNCLACKIGTYPDCQFLSMKQFYLEESKHRQEDS